MNRKNFLILILLISLFLNNFLLSQEQKQRIYIINLDGMPAEYFNLKDKDGNLLTPNLKKLADDGVYFRNCYSQLPALTVCNHTSIVTGASTGIIGIYGAGAYFGGIDEKGNALITFYKREDIQAETIFDAMKGKDKNLKTSAICGKGWVCDAWKNENLDINITGHEYPDYVKPPEAYILGGTTSEGKQKFPLRLCFKSSQDSISGCLNIPGFEPSHFPSDNWVINSAIEVIKKEDPNFIYILLAGMDDAGHIYGNFLDGKDINPIANPEAMMDQLKITDKCVGDFIDFLKSKKIYDDATIVLTADHGMTTARIIEEEEVSQFDLLNIFKKLMKGTSFTVDVRKILKDSGFPMIASDGENPYNPEGAYEWCGSEGPNIYIFGTKGKYKEKIISVLKEYNDKNPYHPMWKILDREMMANSINDKTGFPFELYNKKCAEGNCPVKWPDVIIFLHKGFMAPAYSDTIRGGGIMFMKKVNFPPISPRIGIGFHGTYSEQNVPLVIKAKGIKKGYIEEKNVQTIDIIPTVCDIYSLPIPSNTKGENLFKFSLR